MSKSVESAWERWSQAIAGWTPYLTLAISTILSLFQPRQTSTERLGTAVLVALTAAWVFLMYTRAPTPRRNHSVRIGGLFRRSTGARLRADVAPADLLRLRDHRVLPRL
ncbi:MAG TPA: hypothetical protein VKE41_08405 [Roseiflexaceae bacterium]|nr:hypothetical protein [Roseiflexaceae bacterium]